MDEQIKPVAWYAELDAPNFRDHGQKYGPEWPIHLDRLPVEQTAQLEHGEITIRHRPLYSQQSIDALRAELAEQCRLHAIGMERELALIGRADRAEAEAKALREDGERYRWLRDLPDESPHECISTMPGDMWDAAIDAARKGE